MRNRVAVLIVGAGPTGLTMASELARRGISFRFIDEKQQAIASSNATWIQPRTLEVFDLMGVVDPFLRRGNRCEALQFYINGQEAVRVPMDAVPTPYPYALMLPQHETESLLLAHAKQHGAHLERGVRLTGVLLNEQGVTCNLTLADGSIEMLDCDFLIAADGANSSVRAICGLHFEGEDLNEQFIVADATIESGLPKRDIHLFFEQGKLFAAFPMGHDKYRITANLHLPYPRKLFTEREVIEMAQERAHGAYYIKKVEWISPFWIHSKVVKAMRHQGVFLVGDAAHIHSPVGGQGMNTGIQDAFNLAWKLALVLQGQAKASLLDSYHDERYPIIHGMVKETEAATKMVMSEDGFIEKLTAFSEGFALPVSRAVQGMLNRLAQIDLRYENSKVIDYANVSGHIILQGMRAPDAVLGSGRRLYDAWRDGRHHLLVFLGAEPSAARVKAVAELTALVEAKFGEVVVDVVAKTVVPALPKAMLDEDGLAHDAYYADTQPMLYLVRPDNVIAAVSKSMTLAEMAPAYLF